MIIHTNKGEIELIKCAGDLESLPELCFECKILSQNLYDEIENIILEEKKRQFHQKKVYFNEMGYKTLEEFQADNAINEYSYIILFLRRTSDKVIASYENRELKDTKQELKEFILSALGHYYF